jgi:hypothetical protein
MKDFYDLYALCTVRSFDGATLYEAVKRTFERRKTILPSVPTIFTDTFPALPEKQIQWRAFLNRTEIEVTDDFMIVMTSIRKFLSPLYDALINKTGFTDCWDRKTGNYGRKTNCTTSRVSTYGSCKKRQGRGISVFGRFQPKGTARAGRHNGPLSCRGI